MRSTRLAVLAALVGVVACSGKETPEQATARMSAESDSAMTAVRAKGAKFAASFNAGQMDSVAAIYMELGRVMPPNAKTAVGRPAIKAWLLEGMGGTPHLSLSTTDVVANGPVAVERGTYTMTITPPAGAKAPNNVVVSDTGKFLTHWSKVNGDWQIADDIFNSDKPAGPPPKAAPTKAPAKAAPAKAATKAPAKAPAKVPAKTKAPTKKSGA
jgi:ketosteroid isomerase-like protein